MPREPQLHPVGTSEGVTQEGDGTADVAAGALDEENRFRPVLGLDGVEPLLDHVERLVPTDPLELALAPFSDPA